MIIHINGSRINTEVYSGTFLPLADLPFTVIVLMNPHYSSSVLFSTCQCILFQKGTGHHRAQITYITKHQKAHKEERIENFGSLGQSEGRAWLTVYLSCWGSFVRAKHITDWWSLSWGQHASLLHIHTVLYIDTLSDIPHHNNMKPTKRPPPASFISVWIQAESIYLPVRPKVSFCTTLAKWLVRASAGSTRRLWNQH